jgi:hypothetical protein
MVAAPVSSTLELIAIRRAYFMRQQRSCDVFFRSDVRASHVGTFRQSQETVARARGRSYIRDQLHNSCKRGYRVIQLRRRLLQVRSYAAAMTLLAAPDVAPSNFTIDQQHCRLFRLRVFDH